MKKLKIIPQNKTLVVLEGLGLTIILVLISTILIYNNIKRINNGRYNYDVYQYERDTLEDLVKKNEELKSELEYVNSLEYKRLVLREVLGYAYEDETVYKRKEDPTFYTDIEKRYIEVSEKEDYEQWWLMLL